MVYEYIKPYFDNFNAWIGNTQNTVDLINKIFKTP